MTLRVLIIIFLITHSFNSHGESFSDFIKDNRDGVIEQKTEFNRYKQAYLAEYENYKERIKKEWDEARVSSPKNWVTYGKDLKTRTTVDYDSNTIEVAIRNEKKPTPQQFEKKIKQALNISAETAAKNDPILSKINQGDSLTFGGLLMMGFKTAKETVGNMLKTARMHVDQDSKGSYSVVKVKMPQGSESKRIRQFLPYIKKYSKKYNINPSLILAIIKTESAFNPLAQSHIPAFGLMQIVPESAGMDVQKLIYGKDKKPSSKMLFNPEVNIEHGVAYLHILQTRYLKGISRKQSLEFCSIAAYNTGAGNVARAFNGTTNIKKAIPKINSMNDENVYMMLRKRLKYKEARDYIMKVRKNKQLFKI